MTDSVAARVNMVARQLRPNQVRDARLLDAMAGIPREAFLPAAKRGAAYVDDVVEVARGRFLLSPMVFARLAEEAAIGPAERVLDLGCLTGYSTAVLARLAGAVTGIEIDPGLAETASALVARYGGAHAEVARVEDLAAGHPAAAPYDVILCEGTIDFVPDALAGQLAEGGRLLAIVARSPSLGQATLFERADGIVSGRVLFDATVPMLPGFARAPGFVFA